MIRHFNPKFMKQFYPEKHVKYVQQHPKYTLAAGGFKRMSTVSGMNDEYIRLGHAIDTYGYLERKGHKLVKNNILKNNSFADLKDKTPKKFLFYGPEGTGTRTSITAVLNACYEKNLDDPEINLNGPENCIFLYIPNGLDLIHTKKPGLWKYGQGFGHNNAELLDWVAPSRNPENGGIDHPRFSNYILNHFLNQNKHSGVLKEVKTQQHCQFTETISLPVGTSLQKLAEFGLTAKGIYGTRAFEHLVTELTENPDRPALITGCNSVHNLYALKSNIFDTDVTGEIIDNYHKLKFVDELNIVKSARKLVEGNWKNGAILLELWYRSQSTT